VIRSGDAAEISRDTSVLAVLAVTCAVCFTPPVAHSAVTAGTLLDEHRSCQLHLDTGGHTSYPVNARAARFLSEHITLSATGSARLLDATVTATPRQVIWTGRRIAHHAAGAALKVNFSWNTPPEVRDGASGEIQLDFPDVSWL
jgi:hypothetical protein